MENIDPTVSKIINDYLEQLKNEKIAVTEIRLFGSRAKGTHHEWSDIDLAIISPIFGRDYLEEFKRLSLIAAKIKPALPIESHPFHPDELQDPWSTLASEIRKYGIKLNVS